MAVLQANLSSKLSSIMGSSLIKQVLCCVCVNWWVWMWESVRACETDGTLSLRFLLSAVLSLGVIWQVLHCCYTAWWEWIHLKSSRKHAPSQTPPVYVCVLKFMSILPPHKPSNYILSRSLPQPKSTSPVLYHTLMPVNQFDEHDGLIIVLSVIL